MPENKLKAVFRHARIILPGIVVALSLLLTFFVTLNSITPQPVGDTWSNPELFDRALAGEPLLPLVLERHNDAHLIAIPKLLYLLDGWLTHASGKLLAFSSLGFMLLTILLVGGLLSSEQKLTLQARTLFCLLAALLLGNILQAESLINPSNLQWSAMSAGICGLALACFHASSGRLLTGLVIGMVFLVLALGSALPLPVLIVTVLFYSQVTQPQRCKKMMLAGLALALLLLLWEAINISLLQWHEPLIIRFFQGLYPETTLPAEQWQATKNQLQQLGAQFPVLLIIKLLTSLGSFLLPALKAVLPDHVIGIITLPLLFCLYRLFTVDKIWSASEKAFAFILLSCFFTALAASVFRLFLPDAYTLRFANTGLLFVTSFIFLGYQRLLTGKIHHLMYFAALVLYLPILCWQSTLVAGEWLHGQNHIRYSQVAYALDIDQPGVIVENPYSPWIEEAHAFISTHKQLLKRYKLGIYHDPGYQASVDLSQLPAETVDCSISKLQQKQFRRDTAAHQLVFRIKEKSRFEPKSLRAVFIDHKGSPIGFARPVVRQLDERPKLFIEWVLGGMMRFDTPDDRRVSVIVFDEKRKCDAGELVMQSY